MNVWAYFFGESHSRGPGHPSHRDLVHSAKNQMQKSVADAKRFGKAADNARMTAESAVKHLEEIRDQLKDENL